MWLIVNCKNGISSLRNCTVDSASPRKSAWHMDHRIRFALHQGSFDSMLTGEVEADETFIGGKARNMHVGKRKRRITGTGGKDKTAVMGILERGGKVRTTVVPNRKKKALQAEVKKHVRGRCRALYRCAAFVRWTGRGLRASGCGSRRRVRERKIHTNGLENFWSLLKRGINGTYVSVEPFHLFRYLDEQAYRYNNRATKEIRE